MRVTVDQWLPVPVLTLEVGDIVESERGTARVCGWNWNLTRRQVWLRTVVLRTSKPHTEVFAEDAMTWQRQH